MYCSYCIVIIGTSVQPYHVQQILGSILLYLYIYTQGYSITPIIQTYVYRLGLIGH